MNHLNLNQNSEEHRHRFICKIKCYCVANIFFSEKHFETLSIQLNPLINVTSTRAGFWKNQNKHGACALPKSESKDMPIRNACDAEVAWKIKTKSKNSFLAFSFDNLGDTDTWKIKCSSTRDQTFNCSSNGTSRFQGLIEITQNRNEAFSLRINVKMLMQKQLICFHIAECAFDLFTYAFKSYCCKG